MKKPTIYIVIYSLIAAVIVGGVIWFSQLSSADPSDHSEPDGSAVIGDATVDSSGVFKQTFSISLSALSGHLPNISNVIIADDTLYFTSTKYTGAHSLTHNTRIFSAAISDLENIVLTELTNYSVPPVPADKHVGGVLVTSMQIDGKGNLWIAEAYGFTAFDVPHGFDIDNAVSDELQKFESTLESYRVIRKLDNLGTEIRYIDLSELSTQRDRFGVVAFNIDEYENIFIGSGSNIYALASTGESLFTLEASGFIGLNSIIRLQDGAIAVVSINTETLNTDVQIVDTSNNTWGESFVLTSVVHAIYPGSDEYYFIYNTGTALFSALHSTNETVKILDWTESGVTAGVIDNLLIANEHIIFTHQDYEGFLMDGSEPEIMLIVLSAVDSTVMQEVTTLTVARFGTRNFALDAISHFNRVNDLYRIEIIDYYFDPGGWIPPNAAVDARNNFVLDVLAGNAPDILILYPEMFGDLVGSGLLEDLYGFIDRDAELSRSDFMEDIFRKTEVDGALYHIFPFFSVETVLGHPVFLGHESSWGLFEFINVLDANPQATLPMGRFWEFNDFFSFFFSPENYINWETGSTYFDTDSFVELIEFVKAYFSEDMLNERHPVGGWPISDNGELFVAGDQIMLRTGITSFADYAVMRNILGGEVILKGYPRENISGNSIWTQATLAISTTSNNKEGAWEFVRMFLTEDWQQRNMRQSLGFPTNRAVFERALEDSKSFTGRHPIGRAQFQIVGFLSPLTPDDIGIVLGFIDSAVFPAPHNLEPLSQIVLENVNDFMNGLITAEEAARRIQSRASRFVSERS